jgi:hypothetical protein
VTKGIWPVAIVFLPFFIFFTALAFPWSKDQPTEIWLASRIRFFLVPHKRIWNQTGMKDLVTITVPKREVHRQKVRKYVTSGLGRFGAGTDSAPHDQSAKSRCHGCAAGIFTAYSAVELYTKIFEEDGALENLGAFLSTNFLHVYGVEPSNEMMTIRRQPNAIPATLDGIPVFMGGDVLSWKVVR